MKYRQGGLNDITNDYCYATFCNNKIFYQKALKLGGDARGLYYRNLNSIVEHKISDDWVYDMRFKKEGVYILVEGDDGNEILKFDFEKSKLEKIINVKDCESFDVYEEIVLCCFDAEDRLYIADTNKSAELEEIPFDGKAANVVVCDGIATVLDMESEIVSLYDLVKGHFIKTKYAVKIGYPDKITLRGRCIYYEDDGFRIIKSSEDESSCIFDLEKVIGKTDYENVWYFDVEYREDYIVIKYKIDDAKWQNVMIIDYDGAVKWSM